MLPLLALIICLIFVLWLLLLDHKQNPSASLALWVPTIWMILIAGRPLDSWFGVGTADIEPGSTLERVVFSTFLFLALIILVRRHFNWYGVIKKNIWLILLLCYMFFSIIWSDVPYISLKRWIKELVAVVMAFVILSEADPRKAAQNVLRRSIYVLIPFSLLLINFFPDYGIYGDLRGESNLDLFSWIGVTSHKNALGRICFISVLFLTWSLVWRRQSRHELFPRYQMQIDMLVLGMALFIMKGPGILKTFSANAIVTLIVGLATFFGLLGMKKFKRSIGLNTLRAIITACIVFGVTTVFAGGLIVGGEFTSILNRKETLTGRDIMWAQFTRDAMMEPIIGHGIGGFWTDAVVNHYKYYSAHNGYLDVILNYGFVGLLFFSMFLLSYCRKAYKELSCDFYWGSFLISLLIMTLIYDIAESSLESFTNQLTAILVILSVSSVATPNGLNGHNNSSLIRESSDAT
jgi:exopolysaccharide production protein ExoQ